MQTELKYKCMCVLTFETEFVAILKEVNQARLGFSQFL